MALPFGSRLMLQKSLRKNVIIFTPHPFLGSMMNLQGVVMCDASKSSSAASAPDHEDNPARVDVSPDGRITWHSGRA